MNSTNCTRPVSVVKLKNSTPSSTPMRMAPARARGNETNPPISAAAKPRSRVSGPICTRSADDWSVAVRKIAIVARNPAIAHTPVDTIFGLMPVRRARSELVAARARHRRTRCGRAATRDRR